MTFRSEKLRRAVAELPCVCCGREGFTQAAHANLQAFGKGFGHKASDAAVMALCVEDHRELDQGSRWTKEEKRHLQYQWMAKTYVALVECGALKVA